MTGEKRIGWMTACVTGMLLLTIGMVCAVGTAHAQPAETRRTGQTATYAAGDDGALERGVTWPAPRFADNFDGTVTDNLTGLIWLKNANCSGGRTWHQALTYCNTLASGMCGLNDGSVAGQWHLPNRKELFSLIDYSRYGPALPQGHPFTNVQSSFYWSSSTNADGTDDAWVVGMNSGNVYDGSKTSSYYVWPVRGGQSGPFGHLAISHPNGGEALNKGQYYTIVWDSNNVSGDIQIDLYKGGTEPDFMLLQLAAAAENNGEYPFSPPEPLEDGDDYYIRISAEGGTIWDFSNAPFSIVTPTQYFEVPHTNLWVRTGMGSRPRP